MRKLILAIILMKGLVSFGQSGNYDSAYSAWYRDRKHHVYILQNPCILLGTRDTVPVELVAIRNGVRYKTDGYVVGEIVKDDQNRNGCGQIVGAGNIFLDIFKHEFSSDWKIDYDESEFNPK